MAPVAVLLPELPTLVRDGVLWSARSLRDGYIEHLADLLGRRFSFEHAKAHHPTREVVQYNRNPVADGSTLREREGTPRYPEARACRHDRVVDGPDVVRVASNDTTAGALAALGNSRLRVRLGTGGLWCIRLAVHGCAG